MNIFYVRSLFGVRLLVCSKYS